MEFSLNELINIFDLKAQKLRSVGQKLSIKPTRRRRRRADLYDVEASIRLIICYRLWDSLKKSALVSFLREFDEISLYDTDGAWFAKWSSSKSAPGLTLSVNVISISSKLREARGLQK